MKKHDQKPLPEGAIISQPFKRSPLRTIFTKIGLRSRRTKLILLMIVLVLAIGTAYYVSQKDSAPLEEKSFGTPLPTEEQAAAQLKITKSKQFEELRNKAPAESASLQEKLSYYEQLETLAAGIDNYQAAAAAFETRDRLTNGELEYTAYYVAASYYHATGDKIKALALLDKAEAKLPAEDNYDIGYIKASALKTLQEKRKEYSQ